MSAAQVYAEEWRATPRLTVDEAYTDNVDLAPKGQERSDFISSISPGIGVRGRSRHVTLGVDYDPQVLLYAKDSNRNQVRQRLLGTGQAEVLEKMLFFDASASIDQEIINPREAVGGTDLTANDNRRTVQTYNVGPTLRNHFGSYADSEVSYHFSAVNVDSEEVSNTTTHDALVSLRNGDYFGVFGWTLTYSESRTERSGANTGLSDTPSNQRSGRADFQYALFPTFSLLAGVGYDDIEDQTLTQGIHDPAWDVGFLYRPSRALSFRITQGMRYGDPNTNAELNYKVSAKTEITGSYTQSIQTSQALLARNLSDVTVNQSGQLIDPRTGLPFEAGNQVFGLENQAFRQDRLSVRASSVRGRNTYRAEFFKEDRKFDLNNQTEKSIGGQIRWSRQLTRVTDLDVGFFYSRLNFDDADGRVDNQYSIDAGLNYHISGTLNGRLSFRRTERDSSVPDSDTRENVILIGIRKEL